MTVPSLSMELSYRTGDGEMVSISSMDVLHSRPPTMDEIKEIAARLQAEVTNGVCAQLVRRRERGAKG